VLRGYRLDAVPVQHQKMRRKALRLLLRHTDEAVDELRDDNDEMLRGRCLSCDATNMSNLRHGLASTGRQ
jgi:hypothetical protein